MTNSNEIMKGRMNRQIGFILDCACVVVECINGEMAKDFVALSLALHTFKRNQWRESIAVDEIAPLCCEEDKFKTTAH